MRYGFVSDVHGDLEGLQWALSALASVDQVVFLGMFAVDARWPSVCSCYARILFRVCPATTIFGTLSWWD